MRIDAYEQYVQNLKDAIALTRSYVAEKDSTILNGGNKTICVPTGKAKNKVEKRRKRFA